MIKINRDYFHISAIQAMAAGRHVYDRGAMYFNNGFVGPLNYDETRHLLSATIEGTSNYEASISLTIDGRINRNDCSCPAYESFPGLCKHLVALLLKIGDQVSEQVIQPDKPVVKSSGKRLIAAFQDTFLPNQVLPPKGKDTLQFEYELHFKDSLYSPAIDQIELRVRVGTSRLYVVKELEEFIEAVQEQSLFSFTAKFAFDPSKHQLHEEDQHILHLIHKVQESRNTVRYGHVYNSRANKFFQIPSSFVPDFLAALAGRNVVAAALQKKPLPLSIVPFETRDRLQMKLQQKPNSSTISLVLQENQCLFFTQQHQVLYKEGVLYQLTKQQSVILETLLVDGNDPNELGQLNEADMEAFCSYVLPKLQQVASIDIDDSLSTQIQDVPLKAMLHLDIADDVLAARVVWQYGQYELNPYAEDETAQTNVILVRDLEKEGFIQTQLQHVPFAQEDEKLLLRGEEEITYFLFEQLPDLQNVMDIYTSAKLRQMIAPLKKTPSVSLSKNDETSWLNISFSLDGIPAAEVDEVLAALRANRKYYRLPNGAFLHLHGDEFSDVKQAIDHLAPAKGALTQAMSVPLYKALSLEDEAAQSMKLSSSLRELISDIRRPDFIEEKQPAAITASLRDYQLTGFHWMHTLAKVGLGGILADDMGLGKTLQTITFLQALADKKTQLRALIVAPASLLYNWQKEFQQFAPDLPITVIAGTKAERTKKIEESTNATVLITSYPLIQREAERYQAERFDVLVLDEAQAIKNETSKTGKAIRSLQAASSFALTGTPIENRLEELYSIFHTLLPGSLGTKKAFKELNSAELARRVRPFILRRLKKEVLTELPDKIEQTQYIELTADQKKIYVAQVKQLQAEVASATNNNQFQEQRMQILAGLTKLRQICCHPNLVVPEEKLTSGKFDRLLEYVEEGLAAGQRMVIFSQFTSMLALIRTAFDARGWIYHSLDGQTPVKDRLALTERFNEGEHDLFLISMKAGGTGLNLTGGDTVILFDTWWNPAVEQQAADRVYRFGQTKNVQVIKFITTGTIEEKMLEMQERKKALVDEVIHSGEQSLTSLRAEDIKELLTF